jgi:asparagine synthase (glutamine-hydrolysing)
MCRQVVHRGPDDEGIYVKGGLGLGMRRLSIIDLASPCPPVFNEDGTVCIVYNGEAYNFQELRRTLRNRGHVFRTDTDTEVLVHAYEEYGAQFVKKLRGMYAFALWDEPKKRLVLARDRLGKKPLYYTVIDGTIWFCSEIKSILVDPQVPREVDVESLDLYLTFNYVPAPRTIFEGIRALPPAHMLICENGSIKVERYWNLNAAPRKQVDEEECLQELYGRLEESVRMRLVSDVPLGAFLSGGIDSSIIVGLMASLSDRPVKTFSIGFAEEEYSELAYARLVAERFGTDHREYIVTSDVEELIPKLVYHFDEPVGDSSAIPTYYVAKMTRESVTVALSGDGGDELFAGYGKYPILWRIAGKGAVNTLGRAIVSRAMLAAEAGRLGAGEVLYRIQRGLGYRCSTAAYRDYVWRCRFDEHLKNKVYAPEMRKWLGQQRGWKYYESKADEWEGGDAISKILYVDLTSYLPDDLLVKTDITSMANSLEVRTPFLDHPFVEFASRLPNAMKLRNGGTKYILKRAFERLLPKEICRRGKMGFSIPIDKWFREDLREYADRVLLHGHKDLTRYFDEDALKAMLDEHCKGTRQYGIQLWLLSNFAVWHEMYIQGSAV